MMHHPNMHHQAMSGHPPQHLPAHQGMPPHHQMPPHQMHRENRHVTLTRVPLGPSTNMGHPQGMNMGVHQPPPHPIRSMHHGPQHHVPMKPMRRPYVSGGYSGVSYAPPEPRVDANMHHAHAGQRTHDTPRFQRKTESGSVNKDLRLTRPPPTRLTPNSSVSSVTKILERNHRLNTKESFSDNGPQTTSTVVRTPPAPAVTSTSGAGDGAGSVECPPSDDARPANSKEKTPMCLVNELARYNKIKHQYRLTSEMGPAHKKVFTVTLRLGDTEEYTAEGSSIKRAQHAAASAALAATGFPPPPPRAANTLASTNPHHRHSGAVMPTVELNALAMKLCQPAVYAAVPPVPAPTRPPRARPPAYPHMPPFPPNPFQRLPALIYRVRVSVGGRAWLGEGVSPQAARHDAAARALQELRPADMTPSTVTAQDTDNGGTGDASADILNSDGVKSPVSLVHELALKRNMSVTFTVKSERGPPHMRVFITACTVGDMETEGEGNGKKVSKRRAAERMLDEMRRRWPPALLRARPTHPQRPKPPAKKKPRNLIKQDGVASPPEVGNGADNPISRLAVARHAARARSPQYRVIEERGAARRREFLVQCDAPPHSATGLGPNKKAAKRRAAHNVLLAMEGVGECPLSATNGSETNGDAPKGDIKRTEGEPAAGGGASSEVRQPVPGVLMMDYHQRTGQPTQPNGVSETSATGGVGGTSPGAKAQLMYLSQLLGFAVNFSDFPKRNHGEYLSLVSLSTEPPVMCHGGGPSTQHSHEQCARAALRALALMGLDATNATTPSQTNTPTVAGAITNGTVE